MLLKQALALLATSIAVTKAIPLAHYDDIEAPAKAQFLQARGGELNGIKTDEKARRDTEAIIQAWGGELNGIEIKEKARRDVENLQAWGGELNGIEIKNKARRDTKNLQAWGGELNGIEI